MIINSYLPTRATGVTMLFLGVTIGYRRVYLNSAICLLRIILEGKPQSSKSSQKGNPVVTELKDLFIVWVKIVYLETKMGWYCGLLHFPVF